MALIYTGLTDTAFTLPTIEPGEVLQRLDQRWRIRGPDLVTSAGLVATEYLIIGSGLGTVAGALPQTGTVTGIYHYAGLLSDTGGTDPFTDLVVAQSLAFVTGLAIAAAALAAALAAGTIADLILAGDDQQRFTPALPDLAGFASFSLRAGAGDDTLTGSFGDVRLLGEAGDDLLALPDDGFSLPNQVSATLEGGEGDDTLTGGPGADALRGGEGVDRLSGGRGNDTLEGGPGRDQLRGGDGNDVLILPWDQAAPAEILDGGAGMDRLAVLGAPGVEVDLAEVLVAGIEILQLNGAVRLTRAQLDMLVRIEFGGEAVITLADSGVTDLTGTAWYGFSSFARLAIQGSVGRDVIIGRDSADVGPAQAGMVAAGARDLIRGGGGDDLLVGGGGADTLEGEEGNDRLVGDGGADSLSGGAGNDTLDPGRGQGDVLAGGPGNDSYLVRHASTIVIELAGEGARDVITSSVTLALPDGVEELVLAPGQALDGTGNTLANTITGNAAANRLSGLGGADTLAGDAGDDLLQGGIGADSLDGGAGADRIEGGPGRDQLRGGEGADLFVYGAPEDSGTVGTARDTILDFQQGLDRILLAGIDANTLLAGVQGFTFIGAAAFVTGAPGQLRAAVLADGILLEATLDGDRRADFAILVQGATGLGLDDLILV